MRVLQLIGSLQAGGAERTAINYANLLSVEIEKTFLCTTRLEGALKDALSDDVEYLFLNKKRALDFKALKKLNDFIKTHKINVIHAHSTSYFLATLLKLFNRDIKLIWHDHYGNSEFVNNRKHGVLKLCSFKFNAIISVNVILKKWAEEKLKCKSIFYLNNTVVAENKEIKETFLKGDDGKRILCLANLRLQKNHFMLIEAFNNVVKLNKDWTLHLIGSDLQDAYSNELKKTIKNLKLENRVFIYGSKNDVNNILNQSTIGVLSSDSEGLPLTLLEYSLAKLPIVATNVGDCNKVISNKSEGQLVNPNDVNAFSKALLVYMNNSELRKQHAVAVYKNVETNFSAKKTITQLISIYKT